MGQPRIELKPNPALLDDFITIQLWDFPPESVVTLNAELTDDLGQCWQSAASFLTDSSGSAKISEQPPQSGTYTGADPMGLFWAMRPARRAADKRAASMFMKDSLAPLTMTFTAQVGGQTLAAAMLERQPAAPEVVRQAVREDNLVGTLFLPRGVGSHPAVVVLGGAEGGLQEHAAALLASHGFAALALAYFGMAHLPRQLVQVPLEYFEMALRWLAAHPHIDGERLGVVGAAQGGALALLLGAMFPQVRAVAAYAPSSVVFEGIANNPLSNMFRQRSAWQYGGEPLPFLPYRLTPGYLLDVLRCWLSGRPVLARPVYEAGLDDRAAAERAAIAVEKINGPVLVISGGEDAMWPAGVMAQQIADRLAANDYAYPFQHLHYPDAGHLLWFPLTYTPATVNHVVHPLLGLKLALGGQPRANALARAEAWAQVQQFLAAALG